MNNEDCLFCKIAKKEIPSEVIYEDDRTFAFLDINPNNIGHALVIPKSHAKNIYEITSDEFTKVMETVHRLAPAIKSALNADGINLGMNNDPAAGQIIPHAHVHIIPRYTDDGFKHWHGTKATESELCDARELIVREINK